MTKLVIELPDSIVKHINTFGFSYPDKHRDIIDKAIKNGRPLEDYLYPFKDNKKGDT